MKMLSVANVASLLGGTGRCALDCIRALPDWQHEVIFRGGNRIEECRQEFGCPVHRGTDKIAEVAGRFQPDVILYHNTQGRQIPIKLECQPLSVYYQHSKNLESLKRTFRARLIVSHALAERCDFPEAEVLYQPCAKPPFPANFSRAKQFTVGRLCTPTASKWDRGQLTFYLRLMRSFPEVRWEFVGAPDWFAAAIWCQLPHASMVFHPASVEAGSLLHSWDVLLYRGVWESYGRTICEAQQCGCIPIAEAWGGVVEQIRNGIDGFCFHSEDQLREQLRRLTQDQKTRLQMKINACHAGRARGSLVHWRREFLKRIGLEITE